MKVRKNIEYISHYIYHTIYHALYHSGAYCSLQDIVPMEQVSSMVSNGGGSVTMQRDDEYRNRIMKSKCVSASMCVSLSLCVCILYMCVCTTPVQLHTPPPLSQHSEKKVNCCCGGRGDCCYRCRCLCRCPLLCPLLQLCLGLFCME